MGLIPTRTSLLNHSMKKTLVQKLQNNGVPPAQVFDHYINTPVTRTPTVSRFGLAVRRLAGKQRDLGSNPLRICFLFKSCGLWTLSCDFVPHNYETLKWLSSLPTLMQKSFWW